jgi:pimeloyl-ACP methyl ester carboxylesterase
VGSDTFSLERYDGDLAAIVEHEQLDDIVLVGHSMGVQVMLEAFRLLRGREEEPPGVGAQEARTQCDHLTVRGPEKGVGDGRAVV